MIVSLDQLVVKGILTVGFVYLDELPATGFVPAMHVPPRELAGWRLLLEVTTLPLDEFARLDHVREEIPVCLDELAARGFSPKGMNMYLYELTAEEHLLKETSVYLRELVFWRFVRERMLAYLGQLAAR